VLPGLERRLKHYREVVRRLCSWAERVRELGPATLLVFGSYARGDFNLWSDVDVIVVSPALRGARFTERWRLLPPPPPELPLEAIAWTPEEASKLLAKPSWREALRSCLVVFDELALAPPTCRKLNCQVDR
jgi:predicted nucleotidyltransferase